ncbi:MAG: hypothetical protein ACWIPH_07810 [Ostreibacterium sp.]
MGFWETLKECHKNGMEGMMKPNEGSSEDEEEESTPFDNGVPPQTNICGVDDGSYEWYLANYDDD